MDFILRFAYVHLFYIMVPLFVGILGYRYFFYKKVFYSYPLANAMSSRGFISRHPRNYIFNLLRFTVLSGLLVLIGRPQLIDPTSQIKIDGIDIILVLDVSGSMNLPHHEHDNRSRIDVAKVEAARFIDKRHNDAIGIVLFGNDALTRCPLTADKSILKSIIHDVEIGVINPEGTLLSRAIITAANRLKQSKAKSKVMILLTDGEPSEHDIDPKVALEVAKKIGIKIYTIGIGDDQEIWVDHPFYGRIPMKTTLNKTLLDRLAKETGGTFFEAKNARDMRKIYDTIDTLEKSSIEIPKFSRYRDIFLPLLVFLSALILGELLLAVWWFGL